MDIQTMQAVLNDVSVTNNEPWYEILDVAYNTSDVPKTPKQAFSHPTKADKYLEATIEEIEKVMPTLKPCLEKDVLAQKHFIAGSKIGYADKFKNVDGKSVFDKCKARWCVQGFTQEYGHHFSTTYSGTCKPEHTKCIIGQSIHKGGKCSVVDWPNAFLQSEPNERIFIYAPKGMEQYDENGNLIVYECTKALYGSKQAARCFYEELAGYLIGKAKWRRFNSDQCVFEKVFTLSDGSKERIVMGLHVDDGLVSHNSDEGMKLVMKDFEGHFKMKGYEPLRQYVGLAIDCVDGEYLIHNEHYIHKKYHELGYKEEYGKMKLEIDESEGPSEVLNPSEVSIFRSKVGAAMHVTVHTRFDNAYHLVRVASKMSKPTKRDMSNIDKIWKYMYHTRSDIKLRVNKDGGDVLYGFFLFEL